MFLFGTAWFPGKQILKHVAHSGRYQEVPVGSMHTNGWGAYENVSLHVWPSFIHSSDVYEASAMHQALCWELGNENKTWFLPLAAYHLLGRPTIQ